jgi:type IV pilus assembly protein PilN
MSNIPPNINLLAWRAEQQSKQSRKFGLLIFNSVISAVAIIIIVHIVLIFRTRQLNASAAILQQSIKQQSLLKNETLEMQQQKNKLLPQINTLNNLQADQQQTTQLLNELSTITPAGVYLTNLSLQNQQVTLVGKTVSSAQLAVLIQNINRSLLLNQALLNEMKFDNTTPPYQESFIIQSQLKPSPSEPERTLK